MDELWGTISRSVLFEPTKLQGKGELIQVLEARKEHYHRVRKQEFAVAHNLRLTNNGQPDPKKFIRAVKQTLRI